MSGVEKAKVARSRYLTYGAVIVVIAIVVAAAGYYFLAAPKPQKVTLNWFSHVYKPWNDLLTQQMEKYVADHPNVEIVYSPVSTEELDVKFWSMIEAGNPPDIMGIYEPWFVDLARNGHLDPPPDWVIKDIRDTKIPFNFEAADYRGKTMGYVQHVGLVTFVANTGELQKLGITKLPETWDEMIALDEQLKKYDEKGTLIRRGINLATKNEVWILIHFRTILLSYGGDILTSDLKKGALDTPEALRAAEIYKELSDPKIPDVFENFPGGFTLFDINGEYFKAIVPANWTITATIPLKGTKPASHMYFWFWTVSSKCENKDEAWKFLQYLSSADQYKDIVSQIHLLPLNTAEEQMIKDDPWMQTYVEASQYGVYFPRVPYYERIQKTIAEAIQRMVAGELTPKEAMLWANDRIDAIMGV